MAFGLGVYFSLFLLLLTVCSCSNLNEISEAQLQNLIESESFVTVFIYTSNCKTCSSAANVLAQIASDISDLGIKLVRSDSEILIKQFKLDFFPTILYFRHKRPIIYDGGFVTDEILQWLSNNKEVHILELDDQNFEHLTQASTGATTGDWFVWFYRPNNGNTFFMPTWDTVAARLKNKINVATVDITQNEETMKRFKISHSSDLLFFRHGKIYTYNLPKKDALTLVTFASNWYKNVEGIPVPPIPSPFDRLIDYIQSRLKSEKGIIYLSVGVSAVLLFFVFILKYLNREPPIATSKTKKTA